MNIRVKRIKRKEKLLVRVQEAIELNNLADPKIIAYIRELKDYYAGQWLSDYEEDEQGNLPNNLKRGVLSQDALNNLFAEIDGLDKN